MTALKSSWIRILIFSQSHRTKLFETQFGYSLQTIINLGIEFVDTLIKKFNMMTPSKNSFIPNVVPNAIVFSKKFCNAYNFWSNFII